MVFCEAVLMLLLLFGKDETISLSSLLEASPQTRRVGFAEVSVCMTFCEAELTLLLLFWKRRIAV
jgi:hypothetical protein